MIVLRYHDGHEIGFVSAAQCVEVDGFYVIKNAAEEIAVVPVAEVREMAEEPEVIE